MRPLYTVLAPFYELIEGRDYDSELALIEDALKRHGCKTVVDLGCGTGLHVRELAKRAFDVWGIDISPHMIKTAKRLARGLRNARFVVADYYNFKPPTPFDAALCLNWSIPVTFRDVERFFKNSARLLRDGGILLIDYERPEDIVWEDVGEPVIDSWRFRSGRIVRVSIGHVWRNVMRSRDVYIVFGKPRGFRPPSERERYLGKMSNENIMLFLDVSHVRFYEPSEIERLASRHGFKSERLLNLATKKGYRRLYHLLVKA